MEGADFWKNRARDGGFKQECIDCIAEANGLESAFDMGADGMSFKEIGRVLIVHEDTLTCGFGGEIAAQIADEAFAYLDAPIKRVACADVPSPTHHNLFEVVMPTAKKIEKVLDELVRF